MDKLSIKKLCPKCKGNKTIIINDDAYDPGPPEEITCPDCMGSGVMNWGEAEETP